MDGLVSFSERGMCTTSITDPKVSRTLNAYSSIKVNKRSFQVIEKGKN